MSKLCCIPICRNSKGNRGVLCYPFPATDDYLRSKWIDFVGAADPQRFRWRNKQICAEHFHRADLTETGPTAGAVPTVYSPDEAEEDVLAERDRVMVSESSASSQNKANDTGDLQSLFCRICLKKAAGLIPFSSKLHNESLVDVIYTVTGLVLDEEEVNLPTKICASCVGKIDMAFNVRKEFLHQERVLRNMIKNKQLEAHYRCFDNHVVHWKSQSEIYLNSLMKDVKTELIIEPVEEMVEEHLNDEQEDRTEQPASSGSIQHDPPESNLTVYSESGEEEEAGSSKKIVYSWKELYKPKRVRQVKEHKITEDLPEPTLVPNTCYICNTVHENEDELDSHIEQHVQLVPYTCACSTEEHPIVLKSLITLNKHLQSHLYSYVCDYCPLRYINRKSYILHMQCLHENINSDGYTCDDCGQFFTQKRAFSTHIYKHRAIREGKFKCDHCGKAFSSSALLTRHLRIHTGEKPYECKKCSKRFNHESIFQVHKRSHIGEKAHVCSECNKRFINAPMLRYHMAEHFPDDPRYRTQYSIKRPKYDHVKDDVNLSNPKGIVTDGKNRYSRDRACEFENCTFTTTSVQSWHYHLATHTRKFQCEICARRFPTKQTLVKHVETAHEGKKAAKTIPCTYCDKKFSNNQKLRYHLDMHENNRRHKCSYCEKAFVQVANMKAHERIHTGEKPFPCRACPAAFITSSGRRKHERTHPELDAGQRGVETKVEYSGDGN